MIVNVEIEDKELKWVIKDFMLKRKVKLIDIKDFRIICNHKKHTFKVAFLMETRDKK